MIESKSMKKVKVSYIAKKEVIVDLEHYPPNADLDEILRIEQQNVDEWGVEFPPEQIDVTVDYC